MDMDHIGRSFFHGGHVHHGGRRDLDSKNII